MNRVKNKNQLSTHENQNKKQILLSVVVSCKALTKILEKNLKALSRQNLKRELWSLVFVFKEEQKGSDCILLIKNYFPSHQLLFLPKNQPLYEMRNLALDHISCPYIYFIDEDVILSDPEHLSRLVQFHKKFPEFTVIGGCYLDHLESTFWGRSYNWIARLWAKNHTHFVPAGNLSIKTNKTFKARFYSPNPFGFGGEEVYFLKSLQNEGHQSLWEKQLDAKHLALHNLKDFIKRAWCQGASFAFEENTKSEKQTKGSAGVLFIKEPAPFLIKTAGLFYLFLVRLSAFFYKVKKAIR